jgi:predicted enzyme related to lactoylglutathione lyase
VEGAAVPLDLFAGISVSDYEGALTWYERLLGSPPSFVAHATEAVWELAEHRFVFIEEQVKDAGHAQHTIFVDDLDALVEQIAGRGLDPVERETYSNGVRKATYRDPDGNEIGFGGAPKARYRGTVEIGIDAARSRPRRRATAHRAHRGKCARSARASH